MEKVRSKWYTILWLVGRILLGVVIREHHVIMSEMSLGIQWLLKPDTTLLKNATPEVMESQC